jgi:hypothetical protein
MEVRSCIRYPEMRRGWIERGEVGRKEMREGEGVK